MSTFETGWSKEFPQVEGFYFARRTQTNAPALTIIQVWQDEDEWYAYRFARNEDLKAQDFTRSLYEYLGPLQLSDSEQLAALREAAKNAIKYLNKIEAQLQYPRNKEPQNATAALREALKGS